MPLTAVVDGKTVNGPDLSEEEWTTLKVRHKNGLSVTMGCCGAPGHVRISKNGTRHFYHASAAGCAYEQESREHLEIKEQIYRICKSENWETSVEFPAPDRTWISDVYATRDGRKIVFEIQISTISPSELEDRDRKYRNEGIESYWLLEQFLKRSWDYKSWYRAHLSEEDERYGETIPYVDDSLYATGPENQMFIARGIRSVGLRGKKQTLYTTNNPEISLAVWVREVLNGHYRHYLENTAAACHQKRQVKYLAAPHLIRFREFYQTIIRDKTYRKKVDSSYRIFKTNEKLWKEKPLQRKFDALYSEIDWLEQEYRTCISESTGLFTWKKTSGNDIPRPFFPLESALKIRKLTACVRMFDQWEGSFERALISLERELSSS